MTVYAPTSVTEVSISGAGHSHVITKGEEHMSVSCAACEPELLTMGWARDLRNVPLTFDEIRESEIAQQDIARFEQLKVAESARAAATAVRSAGVKTTRRGSAR